MIIIPVLALAFFALQMDRGNISAAMTSTLMDDLGVNTNAINVGSQLMSAGIVLTEIPSNILLQRFGPKKWLSFQIFAWGLVATFQAFVQNYAAFLATRLVLGLLEGGYIPGIYKGDLPKFPLSRIPGLFSSLMCHILTIDT